MTIIDCLLDNTLNILRILQKDYDLFRSNTTLLSTTREKAKLGKLPFP